jgi:hypothetical protein
MMAIGSLPTWACFPEGWILASFRKHGFRRINLITEQLSHGVFESRMWV